MIFISQNVGHAFFGLVTFVLAFTVLYDLTTSKKASRTAIDNLWGPVMFGASVIYFAGLVLSLSFAQMTDPRIEQGQHMLLAVFILLTSLLCLHRKFLPTARIIQLLGFAIILLFHTHSHGGAAWIASYHRWLFTLTLTLAALFVVFLLTKSQKIITLICVTLFVASVSLFTYTQVDHSHGIAATQSAVASTTPQAEVLRCATTGKIHKVVFNKTGNTLEPSDFESAALCDQVTILNNTDVAIDVETGSHAHHVDYPLVSDQIIRPYSQVDMSLTKIGKLIIHDHYTGDYAAPALAVQ